MPRGLRLLTVFALTAVLLACVAGARAQGAIEDHYARLGVAPTASAKEIRAAYHKMSVKFHPDKNKGSKEAEAAFIKIQQAYEVLKDENKRRAFDAALRHSQRGGGASSRGHSSGTQGSRQGKGDGFSFQFNGRDLTFEELTELLKQWEMAAPIDIRDATRRFRTFLDSVSDTSIREFMDKVLPVNAHDTWGQSLSKRLVRSIMWYSRGFILQFANEFVGKYNEL